MNDRKDNTTEVVSVKMATSLLHAIDALAQRQYRSRSDIVRQSVLRELEANGICPLVAA